MPSTMPRDSTLLSGLSSPELPFMPLVEITVSYSYLLYRFPKTALFL